VTSVSITLPQFSERAEPMLEVAVAAEELGIDGVFLVDHLVPLGDPTRPVLELAGSVGAVAAHTRTIRVGSLVLRAPLRGPELSAQVAATASAVASGRAIIGLGAGDAATRDELERFGLACDPLDGRLAALEATIAGIRRADPAIPVWIGGKHPRILELAGRMADGWNRWAGSPDDLPAERPLLGLIPAGFTVSWGGTVLLAADRASVDRAVAGRSAGDEVLAGTPDEVAQALTAYVRAGATHLVLSLLPRGSEVVRLFADEVRPRLPVI
jgi:alkanesulfonate monooxygenase SsuD/methylene tetrahydromethanopterin reductase-like flavin-dependent oxidoreductase (luciferase family)